MKRIKRILCAVLLLAMALSLAACGSKKSETAPAPDVTPVPAAESAAEAPVTEPAAEKSAKTPPPPADAGIPDDAHVATSAERKAIAEAFVDRDVAELYEAVGYPVSSNYESSCLGPGQDGELVYDGFTVYTYKEGESEVVRVVL